MDMGKVNTPMPTPEPWERQESETAKAWEAFCIYRDMGVDRSLRKVVQQLHKSLTQIGEWSSKYDWVKRVAAWDVEQDRLARIEQLKEIKKMRNRHAGIAKAMIVKAGRALNRIPEDEITPNDISRMIDVASKLERISRGDVGEVIEERDGGNAINPVQIYIPSNGRERDKEDFDDLEVDNHAET